ncbi:MAG: hypothetical protein A3E19_03825 [Planctomycetes bacterium RIFCSPHIGHO2_12_FULL_52_36]|nr:MAG: hypothetical protein A3D89_01395 [Planctomycetes bacterium RIFCSPHIGHO2_02_FULL_52_58]OHB93966.1 MAG: hypothetical protein A3E19_03825 [Planctomycetes bacterium RIFCSPHIGHO2_12_FULL_52_36]
MNDIPIKVRAYSGYRAEERPMGFLLGDREYRVKEVLRSTHEERGGKRVRSFRVLTEEKEVYSLYYAEEEDQWYLETAF